METSYVNKITGFVIALVLGAIMVGGMLAPTVAGIQDTVQPIKITNASSVTADNELFITEDLTESHTFSAESPNTYVTIDGVQINTSGAVQGFYLVSDGLSVCNTGAFFVVSFGEKSAQYSPDWNVALTATFENGTVTFTYREGGTTNTYTTEYTWIGYRVTEGGNYVNKVNVATATYHDMGDFIAMGNYTTGENDTYYVLKDGKITLSESQYTGGITTINTQDVNGTVDLHTGTLRVQVDDESFTPYVWAVKKTIIGHESSGPYYVMFGVITLLAIVMLVVIAANAVRGKYN